MKAQESLSPDQAAFYRPAVHDAFIALSRAKRNLMPDATWFRALEDVLYAMDPTSKRRDRAIEMQARLFSIDSILVAEGRAMIRPWPSNARSAM